MELVIGSKTNPVATDSLVTELRNLSVEGTLYTAYPIFATVDGEVTIDALLVSDRYGAVVFHFPDARPSDTDFWSRVEEEQNNLYFAVTQKLSSSKELRKGRDLVWHPIVVSYLPDEISHPADTQIQVVGTNSLKEFLDSVQPIPPEYFRPLNAAFQRVSTIKPAKKRVSVRKSGSRGAILKKIESEIANLDRWQSHAAIETPEGPQCIRGLAGSGKTIVLALKAAYLHARNPGWTIAITFHTRSLYQQFRELVRRFSYDQLRDEPDWNKLKVIHSWGTRPEPGVYSEIAFSYGLRPRTFGEAKSQYGQQAAFEGACEELSKALLKTEKKPIYDVLLIDEAQDFPQAFFQLVHDTAVTEPKRIVWAYDELQNLGDYSISPPEELFGSDKYGNPFVTLRNLEGKPRQDIVLPVCYRNTPWALATAHALGFGVYRHELVQLFNDPSERIWEKIGYEVTKGTIAPGHHVSLSRKKDTAPEYFYDLLDPKDAVQYHVFSKPEEQAEWVAESISRNITEDELEPSDILVIFPNPLNVSQEAGIVVNKLQSKGISSHVAGITSSRDVLFLELVLKVVKSPHGKAAILLH